MCLINLNEAIYLSESTFLAICEKNSDILLTIHKPENTRITLRHHIGDNMTYRVSY